jgi:hypothetical protein
VEKSLSQYFSDLSSKDESLRLNALNSILALTEKKVDWIYEVLDLLLVKLQDENSFQRTIAIRILCSLSKSDVRSRFPAFLERLLAHTRDESFIASRICIQNIWNVAIDDTHTREIILKHLKKQYTDCINGKHYNLIRQDILQSMSNLSSTIGDEMILSSAKNLAAMEINPKYRQVYERILAI